MADINMVEEVIIKCEPFAPDYQGNNNVTEQPLPETDSSYTPFEEVLVKSEPIKSELSEEIKLESTKSEQQEFKPPVTNVLIESVPSDPEILEKKVCLKQELLPEPSASKLILSSSWEGIQTRRQRFLSERRGLSPIGRKRKAKEKGRRKRIFYSTDVGEAFKDTPASLTEAADKVTTALNEMTEAINMLAKANDKLAKAKLLQTKLEIAKAQAAGLHVSIVHE